MNYRILYVGHSVGTCRQRAMALRSLGHDVVRVTSEVPGRGWRRQLYRVGNRLDHPPDLDGANGKILDLLRRREFDILWIDKGRSIAPKTLRQAKLLRPRISLIAYSPDDMVNPDNQSARYLAGLPLYDLHITTKSYNVGELEKLGARDVLFVDNAFDPETHRPVELTREERERFDAGVGFIGSYESDRASEISRLAESGVEVRIWGAGWSALGQAHENVVLRGNEIHGLDYARAMVATRINLCFLRKVNRDLQTTRSIEIPACGAFMLAERTDEHLALFQEGQEAEFFGSPDELLEKCRYYLEHEAERRRIAAGGLRRCVDGGYSNAERLARLLEYVEQSVRTPAAGPIS